MAGTGLALGPVIVADDLEEFEEELMRFLGLDGWQPRDDAILARFRLRLRRAQRVAHRVRVAESWMRGDGAEAGRSTRDLERDYIECYGDAA